MSLEDSSIRESLDATHRTIPEIRESFRSVGSLRESIDESIAHEVASESHVYLDTEIEEDIYKSVASPSRDVVSESLGHFLSP